MVPCVPAALGLFGVEAETAEQQGDTVDGSARGDWGFPAGVAQDVCAETKKLHKQRHRKHRVEFSDLVGRFGHMRVRAS